MRYKNRDEAREILRYQLKETSRFFDQLELDLERLPEAVLTDTPNLLFDLKGMIVGLLVEQLNRLNRHNG